MNDPSSAGIVAVVDDDAGVLRALAYLLESADHTVRLFASATALVESGCLKEIDCLLTDVDMPGMDGLELLRRVQAARPELPIIVVTGYPETMKRRPACHGSSPRVLTKPFQGPELLAAVSASIRNVDPGSG
jgi:FixJ family two-component response regulator